MHFYLALKMDLSMSLIGWCEVWRCWSSMVSCTYDWNGMLHRFGSYVGSKIVLEKQNLKQFQHFIVAGNGTFII